MSYIRSLTARRSASPSSPRISRASRLSISVQLVDVPTMSTPPRAAGASTPAIRRVYLRASSNMPFDCAGSPQHACPRGTSTWQPSHSSSSTVFCPTPGSDQLAPQPWKYATRRAAGGEECLRAQRWNVRPGYAGSAARRSSPSTRSPTARSGRLRSVKFTSGATGVDSRPIRSGRASRRSRSLKPVRSRIAARACVLISAMCTPCGQTCVHTPQPEQ